MFNENTSFVLLMSLSVSPLLLIKCSYIYDVALEIKLLSSCCNIDNMFVPSKWETVLLCNAVCHWLGANQGSAL